MPEIPTLSSLVETSIGPAVTAELRSNACMVPRVRTDVAESLQYKGDTVGVRQPPTSREARQFDHATGTTFSNINTKSVKVMLDHHSYDAIELSESEVQKSMHKGVIPSEIMELVKTVANDVNKGLLSQYKKISACVGDGGVTVTDSSQLIELQKLFTKKSIPAADRHLVINPEVGGAFMNLFDGTTSEKGLEAPLNRPRYTFSIATDQNVIDHVAGTLAASENVVTSGAATAGAVTLDLVDSAGTSLTGTVKDGDRFTIAGDPTTYLITADDTATSNAITLSIHPALASDVDDATVITLVGNYSANLAFHRNAFCAVIRPFQNDDLSTTADRTIIVDDVTGIAMTLDTWYDSDKQKRFWRCQTVWGVQVIDERLAAIYLS